MDCVTVTPELIEQFLEHLRQKNRSKNSLDTYGRNMAVLYGWLPEGKELRKETGPAWREWLRGEKGFSERSVNGRVSMLNSFVRFLGHRDWEMGEFDRNYDDVQPELSRAEYLRMLCAARQMGREKSYLLIKTMGGAGVRVQEMGQLTAEGVAQGAVRLDSHNGMTLRVMHIPGVLQRELLDYLKKEGIPSGPVFVSKTGRPLSRAMLHHYVSSVSWEARVESEKATPRCLWKMYCDTQERIRASVMALARQSYEHMMEEEQLSVGWDSS